MKDLARLNYIQGQIEVLSGLLHNVGTAYAPFQEAEKHLKNVQRDAMTRELQ